MTGGSGGPRNARPTQSAAPRSDASVPSTSPGDGAPRPKSNSRSAELPNVFFAGEPILLPLADRGRVRVRDGWGVEVYAGRGARDGALLKLPELGCGFYELSVQRDDEDAARRRMRFAVVPPVDLSGAGDSPFGVMTHFAQSWPNDLVRWISAAGIQHIRDEQHWDRVEREPGTFRFPEKLQAYMARADDEHIRPLIVLSFGHPHYTVTEGVPTWAAAPYDEAGNEAFARYARHIVEKYDQIRYVEVWNEYNGGFARGPADGRADMYARTLKRVYDAVKEVRPDVQVLGCSTIGVPLSWIEEVFRLGGADHMDGISIHPYGYLYAPETLPPRIAPLRELIRRYNDGKDMPIWVTEQGYYTTDSRGNRRPITEHTQARYLVRAWTLLMAGGCDKIFWYVCRDDRMFPTMGLLGAPDDPRGRYAPKPAYAAYATMTHQLRGARFDKRDATREGIYSYRFRGDKVPVRVLWARPEADVALATDRPLTVTDLFGQTTTVHPIDGRVHLHLSDAPLYVTGAVSGIDVDDAFGIAVPALSAVGEPMEIGVRLPKDVRRAASRVVVAGIATDATNTQLPPSEQRGERYLPFTVASDGNVIYLGSTRTTVKPVPDVDPFARLISGNRLRVRVTNPSARRTVRLTEAEWQLDKREPRRRRLDRRIAPGETADVDLPVAADPWTLYDARVQLGVAGGEPLRIESTVSDNPVVHRTIAPDGDLSDWDGVAGLDLTDGTYRELEHKRSGPDDLSGTIRLCWDETYLYLAADIRDDTFHQPHHGYSGWRGDNIQLGITGAMPWGGGEWDAGQIELGLSRTSDGPEVYCGGVGVLTDARMTTRREGNHTFYECALPWADIAPGAPEAGTFSFGLYVNDNDGSGRKGYLRWADIKQLHRFQPCRLQP